MTQGRATVPERREEVSTFRLYLMRALYLLLLVALGSDVWPRLIQSDRPLAPLEGVAFSFWAALSALAALGLRYPLKMLPLLMLQLLYKSVWLLAVALPLRSAGQLDAAAREMTMVFIVGIVLDLVVIPWPYVLANYVKQPGNSWRFARRRSNHAAGHVR